MIRVFVGTDGNIHSDAEKVLAHSIKKNTTEENVHIIFMRPGWQNGATGFTAHRYMIPEICDYQGFAIYLDVDMLVLGDIKDLWAQRKPGKWCITPGAGVDDVSVIDCRYFSDLPTEEELRGQKGFQTKQQCRKRIGDRYSVTIPPSWNVKDSVDSDTNLIHYTDLDTQPWHPLPGHPYKEHKCPEACNIFFEYLEEANEIARL
jgi:lipopolysaccharide biosynthesis glycosyltransferase